MADLSFGDIEFSDLSMSGMSMMSDGPASTVASRRASVVRSVARRSTRGSGASLAGMASAGSFNDVSVDTTVNKTSSTNNKSVHNRTGSNKSGASMVVADLLDDEEEEEEDVVDEDFEDEEEEDEEESFPELPKAKVPELPTGRPTKQVPAPKQQQQAKAVKKQPLRKSSIREAAPAPAKKFAAQTSTYSRGTRRTRQSSTGNIDFDLDGLTGGEDDSMFSARPATTTANGNHDDSSMLSARSGDLPEFEVAMPPPTKKANVGKTNQGRGKARASHRTGNSSVGAIAFDMDSQLTDMSFQTAHEELADEEVHAPRMLVDDVPRYSEEVSRRLSTDSSWMGNSSILDHDVEPADYTVGGLNFGPLAPEGATMEEWSAGGRVSDQFEAGNLGSINVSELSLASIAPPSAIKSRSRRTQRRISKLAQTRRPVNRKLDATLGGMSPVKARSRQLDATVMTLAQASAIDATAIYEAQSDNLTSSRLGSSAPADFVEEEVIIPTERMQEPVERNYGRDSLADSFEASMIGRESMMADGNRQAGFWSPVGGNRAASILSPSGSHMFQPSWMASKITPVARKTGSNRGKRPAPKGNDNPSPVNVKRARVRESLAGEMDLLADPLEDASEATTKRPPRAGNANVPSQRALAGAKKAGARPPLQKSSSKAIISMLSDVVANSAVVDQPTGSANRRRAQTLDPISLKAAESVDPSLAKWKSQASKLKAKFADVSSYELVTDGSNRVSSTTEVPAHRRKSIV